jgi:hypothetical protein
MALITPKPGRKSAVVNGAILCNRVGLAAAFCPNPLYQSRRFLAESILIANANYSTRLHYPEKAVEAVEN